MSRCRCASDEDRQRDGDEGEIERHVEGPVKLVIGGGLGEKEVHSIIDINDASVSVS